MRHFGDGRSAAYAGCPTQKETNKTQYIKVTENVSFAEAPKNVHTFKLFTGFFLYNTDSVSQPLLPSQPFSSVPPVMKKNSCTN